jgi:hypothetical protein
LDETSRLELASDRDHDQQALANNEATQGFRLAGIHAVLIIQSPTPVLPTPTTNRSREVLPDFIF